MNKTELIIILDMSGSMYPLTDDTVQGYNSLIDQQKKLDGEVNVTLVLFNDEYKKVLDRVPLQEVKELTKEDYVAHSTTALYDAIGKTITEFPDVEDGVKVMMSITTDGQENSSREFNRKTIKTMLEDKQKLGWDVLFIGANIDAAEAAVEIGIPIKRAAQYLADGEGTAAVYKAMSASVSMLRERGSVDDSWKEAIEEDYKERG